MADINPNPKVTFESTIRILFDGAEVPIQKAIETIQEHTDRPLSEIAMHAENGRLIASWTTSEPEPMRRLKDSGLVRNLQGKIVRQSHEINRLTTQKEELKKVLKEFKHPDQPALGSWLRDWKGEIPEGSRAKSTVATGAHYYLFRTPKGTDGVWVPDDHNSAVKYARMLHQNPATTIVRWGWGSDPVSASEVDDPRGQNLMDYLRFHELARVAVGTVVNVPNPPRDGKNYTLMRATTTDSDRGEWFGEHGETAKYADMLSNRLAWIVSWGTP